MKKTKIAVSIVSLAGLIASLSLVVKAELDTTIAFIHGDDATPSPGAVVRGQHNISVEVQAVSSIKKVSVAVLPDDPVIASRAPTFGFTHSSELGEEITGIYSATWDSDSMSSYNGIYKIVAVAESYAGGTATATIAGIKVSNDAPSVTELSVRIENSSAILGWSPVGVPDVIGYRVLRSVDNGAFSEIAATTNTRHTDFPPVGPPIRYAVSALRYSPVASEGLASQPVRSAPIVLAASIVQSSTLPPPPKTLTPEIVHSKPVVHYDTGSYQATLPYEAPIPVRAMSETIDGDPDPGEEWRSTIAVSANMAKPPYVAASLVALVSALHLLVLASRLSVGSRSKTPLYSSR